MTTCWERAVNSFTTCVFRECLSICMCASFPFGFEVKGDWDFIV